MNKQLLIVNSDDNIINSNTRENCHAGDGILHRAITVFIFNDKNEILLTRRSNLKELWPGFWDTSFSTHVYNNETYEQSAEKRVVEELGFLCKLKYLLKFQYQAKYLNLGSENEVCALLIGNYNGEVIPNIDEVSEYKWISIENLKKDMDVAEDLTPWLKVAFNEYLKQK
jgi:isopentenyl-diphosphate Delta-isomerase